MSKKARDGDNLNNQNKIENKSNIRIDTEKLFIVNNNKNTSSGEIDLSLFERKNKAIELFNQMKENNNISLEEILKYDNTNEVIILEYLKLNVNKLLKENDQNKISNLLELINKACVIINQKDFNQVISILSPKYQIKICYKNYKMILINLLELLLQLEEEDDITDLDTFLDSLTYEKKYEFNHDCEIGENNYYFFCKLFQLLSLNVRIILNRIYEYKNNIIRILFFLKEKDFSHLKEEDLSYFEYIFNLLIKGVMPYDNKYDQFHYYLNSYEDYKDEQNEHSKKVASIKDINDYFIELNKKIKRYDEYIKYEFEIKNEKINVNILDDFCINHERRNIFKTYSYDLNIFNKEMHNIIKKSLKMNNYYNFEYIFSKNIRYGKEYKLSEKYYNKYKEIVIKILKSNAAKIYFDKYYKSYNKDLVYHFDRDDVLEEIFKRIQFRPMYEHVLITSASNLDLIIYINCIEGQYNSFNIHYFERRILQFSKLVIKTIDEILGFFLKKYYSYLTNNNIKFHPDIDGAFNSETRDKVLFFVESEIFGLFFFSQVSLNQALGLFKESFDNYPILYNKLISKDELIKIIEKNLDLFDFITYNKEPNKISVDELYKYLWDYYNKRRLYTCGGRVENTVKITVDYFDD